MVSFNGAAANLQRIPPPAPVSPVLPALQWGRCKFAADNRCYTKLLSDGWASMGPLQICSGYPVSQRDGEPEFMLQWGRCKFAADMSFHNYWFLDHLQRCLRAMAKIEEKKRVENKV